MSGTYSTGSAPQRHEVEVGVARHQRIERPVDVLHAGREQLPALVQLQPPSQTQPAGLGPHREHVRPVRRDAVAHPADAEHEPHEPPVGGERPGRHAADPLAHLEGRWAGTTSAKSRPQMSCCSRTPASQSSRLPRGRMMMSSPDTRVRIPEKLISPPVGGALEAAMTAFAVRGGVESLVQ